MLIMNSMESDIFTFVMVILRNLLKILRNNLNLNLCSKVVAEEQLLLTQVKSLYIANIFQKLATENYIMIVRNKLTTTITKK